MTRRRLIATRTPEADGSFGAAGAWRQAVKATRFVTAHVPAATSLAGAGSRTAVNKPRDADLCPTRSIEPVFHSCPRNHVAFLFTGRVPRGAPAGPGSYHPGPQPG